MSRAASWEDAFLSMLRNAVDVRHELPRRSGRGDGVGAEHDLYDRTAARTSRVVLASYSTSFGLGARLLDRATRDGIDAVYGLVRIAD